MKIKIHTNNIFHGDETVDYPFVVEAKKNPMFENYFDVTLSELKRVGWTFTAKDESNLITLCFDLTECVVIEE